MAGLTLRRRRANRHIRDLCRQHWLHPAQFIQPLFIVEGLAAREAVAGLPEVWRETPASLATQVESDLAAGIHKFLLFCVPAARAEHAFSHDWAAAQIENLRLRFGEDLWLAVDVCLCAHTSHGHCGVLDDTHCHVDNAGSVAELVAQARRFAAAGADCIAPSDMMDGRIGAIRTALDADSHERVALLSYAAKFHSAHYGPFRLAAGATPGGGTPLKDRATYQIDPAHPHDALASAERDAAEGADMLMVKPGLPCLDVLATLSAHLPLPWAVYQTSGEQAAIALLAREGLADARHMQIETWTAFVRAGAQMIISYAARRAPELLR